MRAGTPPSTVSLRFTSVRTSLASLRSTFSH